MPEILDYVITYSHNIEKEIARTSSTSTARITTSRISTTGYR